MSTYSADQIVGATLYAKTRVDLKAQPYDDDPTVATLPANSMVGIVVTWVNPRTTNRANLYWKVENAGQYYWVEHKQGRFSTTALQQQGVQTVIEQIRQDAPPPTLAESAQKLALTGVAIWAGVSILKEMVRARAFSRRYNRYW